MSDWESSSESIKSLFIQREWRKRRALYSSLKRVLPVIFIIMLLLFLIVSQHELKRWEQQHQIDISEATITTEDAYIGVLSDLLMLANHHHLYAADPLSQIQLTQQLLHLAKFRRHYYQLRFISTQGDELVRVDFSGEEPWVVATEKLQNKAHRDYFSQANQLSANEVVISRFDLNIEHKEIEYPIRPMIRFATPVFDEQGVRQGILVLNYLGQVLLDRLAQYNSDEVVQLMLLNEQGNYLYHPDPDARWGEQLSDRPNFIVQFGQWLHEVPTPSGIQLHLSGLFSYTFINPSEALRHHYMGNYIEQTGLQIHMMDGMWRVVAYTPWSILLLHSYPLWLASFSLLLLVSVMLWLFAYNWRTTLARSQDLEQRNNIYAKIFEMSDEMIFITDAKGVILYANDALMRCYGYMDDELIGSPASLFKSSFMPDGFFQAMWKTIGANKSFEGVVINQRRDGEKLYELKVITPISDEQGQIQYYISAGRDVTGDRVLYNREMLIAANMAAGLSHHFGNLINNIKGCCELLSLELEERSWQEAKQSLGDLQTTIQRSQQLLSRIRQVEFPAHCHLQPMIPEEVLLPVLANYQSNHVFPLLRLEVNVATTAMLAIEPLQRAVSALLDNAFDASRGLGEVLLTVDEIVLANRECTTCKEPLSGRFIVIAVSDNGPGIHETIRELVWSPFYTTKESGCLVATTPGLGLTSVRSSVHAMGGHILMQSDSGGTKVSLLFPKVSD